MGTYVSRILNEVIVDTKEIQKIKLVEFRSTLKEQLKTRLDKKKIDNLHTLFSSHLSYGILSDPTKYYVGCNLIPDQMFTVAEIAILLQFEDVTKYLKTDTFHRTSQSQSEFMMTLPGELPLKAEDRSKSCAICFINPKNVVVLPCRHFCICPTCVTSINKCPICRADMTGSMEIFNS